MFNGAVSGERIPSCKPVTTHELFPFYNAFSFMISDFLTRRRSDRQREEEMDKERYACAKRTGTACAHCFVTRIADVLGRRD